MWWFYLPLPQLELDSNPTPISTPNPFPNLSLILILTAAHFPTYAFAKDEAHRPFLEHGRG